MFQSSYILCASLLSIVFTMPAFAQDKAKPAKKAEPLKAEKTVPKKDDNAVEDSIDLDAFFKKGEENAKKGFSCQTPAEPIA